jgi:alpha-methylacyl-CoA racemase
MHLAKPGLPLMGMRVLDFTTLLPGPYASQLLADMGAEVLRIESPIRPDLARITPPMLQDGVSAIHAQLNRNKRALALNLKTPEAVDVIKQLVNSATGFDVVIEGFRPGVMEKLGLGYKAMREVNPDVIYCSITGYGQSGPMVNRAGHDINYVALSGLASYGGGSQGSPAISAVQIADVAGGSHHAVMGIMAAVIQRNGQRMVTSDTYVRGALAGWPPVRLTTGEPTATDPAGAVAGAAAVCTRRRRP